MTNCRIDIEFMDSRRLLPKRRLRLAKRARENILITGPFFDSVDRKTAMDHHLTKFWICFFALLLFGCDAAITESGVAVPGSQPVERPITLEEKIAELNEQNAELIQILEEAESKLMTTLDELEQSKQELANTKTQLQDVQSKWTIATEQLKQVRSRIAEIRLKFNDHMSETAKQLESLNALLPDQNEDGDAAITDDKEPANIEQNDN